MCRCVYCNLDLTNSRGKKHENLCPYNPNNVRKIVEYLKDYLSKNSEPKSLKPFPTTSEFDKFCKRNKIMRTITIRRNYLAREHLLFSDWLIEILEYALHNGIVSPSEFPYYLQYVYDSWLFLSKKEYAKRYELAVAFEDGFVRKDNMLKIKEYYGT